MQKPEFFENLDWYLCISIFFILIIGLVSIYSASIGYQFENNFFKKQLIWIAIGLTCMFFFSFLDFRIILKYSQLFYIIVVLMLVYTHYKGFGSKGSDVSRWISIFGLTIQPSEFAKIAVVCVLTNYFQGKKRIGNLTTPIIPLLILLVPFLLIFTQPDLGTSIVLAIVVAIMIFLAGINWKWIIFTLIFLFLSMPLIWIHILKNYQKERILILFNPQRDPLGTGYHIIQSKIAIGSGTFWGKGLLQGKQAQLNFLPARHTDFIFSVLSEEWGFLGSLIVVLSYCLLIFCILRKINSYQNRATIMLTLGIATIISAQVIINISMVTGLLPVVGLPLPLISYGGSSIITTLSSIGILLNIRKKE